MTIISSKVLAASVAPNGSKITTFELTYPRFIHSEFMTHRVFSRNSASSRAIPIEKMIEDVMSNPVIPIHWGKNERGMIANDYVSDTDSVKAIEKRWLQARDQAVEMVQYLSAVYDLHKQVLNRLLEPWMHITVIATSTYLENFFRLRCHHAAEPHMNALACSMRNAYANAEFKPLLPGEWHVPFAGEMQSSLLSLKVSVARCARGSYLQQHGNFSLDDDSKLFNRLMDNGHWSPFEHQATPYSGSLANMECGNFSPAWIQYRQTLDVQSNNY